MTLTLSYSLRGRVTASSSCPSYLPLHRLSRCTHSKSYSSWSIHTCVFLLLATSVPSPSWLPYTPPHRTLSLSSLPFKTSASTLGHRFVTTNPTGLPSYFAQPTLILLVTSASMSPLFWTTDPMYLNFPTCLITWLTRRASLTRLTSSSVNPFSFSCS